MTCGAGFPACGFMVLSSTMFLVSGTVFLIRLGTGMSTEPADKNVCATGGLTPRIVFC